MPLRSDADARMKDRPEWWLRALGFDDELKESILTGEPNSAYPVLEGGGLIIHRSEQPGVDTPRVTPGTPALVEGA